MNQGQDQLGWEGRETGEGLRTLWIKGRRGREPRIEGTGLYSQHGQRAAVVMGPLICGVKGALSCRKTQMLMEIMLRFLTVLSHVSCFNSM